VQQQPTFKALAFIPEPFAHPLVPVVYVAGVGLAVVAGADVIPRQMIGTAHPPRRDRLRSEQAQAGKALVEAIALVGLQFGGHSL
jgi:hypothetical protein